MLTLSPAVRIYLATGATDLRQSIDGLTALVRERFTLDPLSGHLFLFRNRRGDPLKILGWDRSGFWVLYKRLEQGTFAWPTDAPPAPVEMRSTDLALLLSGVDVSQTLVKKMFNFALDRDWIDANPAARLKPVAPETAPKFWRELDSEHHRVATLFRTLLLTAQRSGEASRMRWSQLQPALFERTADGLAFPSKVEPIVWTIPGTDAKNGLAHEGSSCAESPGVDSPGRSVPRDVGRRHG